MLGRFYNKNSHNSVFYPDFSPVMPRNSAVDPSTGTYSDNSHILGVRVKTFWLSWDSNQNLLAVRQQCFPLSHCP